VHPSVYYNAAGWNGYEYWMAVTPYQGGNNQVENPCLFASHDGDTWVVPAGVTNPVVPVPGNGTDYNSDPDLVMVDGVMHLFWRTVTATQEVIYYKTSTNGTTWSTSTAVITSPIATRRPVSPAVLHDDGTGAWTIFAIDSLANPNILLRWQASTLAGLSSATPVTCTLAVAGRDIWHLDVARWGNELHMVVSDATLGSDGSSGALYFAVSLDGGLTWQRGTNPIIPNRNGTTLWDQALYRSTILPSVVDGEEGHDLWYGIAAPEWRIGRTRLSLSGHRDTVSGAVHGMFDVQHVNRLAAFRGLAPYTVGDSFSRADTTSGLGTSDSGQVWTVSAGAPGIAGGKAYASTAANMRATLNAGLADAVVEIDISGVTSADQAWLVLRYVDASNFLRLGTTPGGSLQLQEVVAGAATVVTPSFGNVGLLNGTLRAVLSGSTIDVYFNGALIGRRTSAQFLAATSYGINTATTAPRFDNFTVRALVNGA
jgi:hypothetical protein